MEKKLDKATKILVRLAEIAHWIGAVGMLVGLVLTFVMGTKAVSFSPEDLGVSLTSYGCEVEVISAAGELNMTALRLYLVGAAIILSLMAMVFRNIHLILKRSENATPFQPDNVRMVREIGYFLLGVPVVGLLMSVVIFAVVGPEAVELSVRMDSFMVGLVVLCLARIFARGMELENDVDGLL